MRNKKRQRNLYLYLLIILGITVGFALLSTTLYINGTANIKKNTWDIHWDDESIVETQGSVEAMTPAAVIDTEKKNVSFAVELELPGDFYEFTVDAKNYGSINGAIDSVKIKFYKEDGMEEWETLPSYIKYSFTYADGSKVEKGDVLEAGKSKKYKFRIEYDSEATTLADGNKTIKPVIDIDEVQTVEEEVIKYNVGKVVYFDPVNYEWCDENSQEATCYKWIVVNRNTKTTELFLLSNVSGFGWSTPNPATVIQTATTTWSNKIATPDAQYDFISEHPGGNTSQNLKVEFENARMLSRAEYDALPQDAKNTIISYCGTLNSQLCMMIDYTNSYENQINPGGVYQTSPLSYIAGGISAGSNNDVRPVIRLKNKENVSLTKSCKDFKKDSWTEIKNVVSKDSEAYPVGCEKEITMQTLGTHTLRIANTSKSDGCGLEGYSETACGFVLEFTDAITTKKMKETQGPAGEGNVGGWAASDLRTFINTNVYNDLPSDLKSKIIDTYVVSGHGTKDNTDITNTDKLYLFAAKEIWNSNPYASNDQASYRTRQLDYYSSLNVTTSYPSCTPAIKKYNNSSINWWLRSAYPSDDMGYIQVSTSGDYASNNSWYVERGVSPAFRIG